MFGCPETTLKLRFVSNDLHTQVCCICSANDGLLSLAFFMVRCLKTGIIAPPCS